VLEWRSYRARWANFATSAKQSAFDLLIYSINAETRSTSKRQHTRAGGGMYTMVRRAAR
jgi:hypothetical protein